MRAGRLLLVASALALVACGSEPRIALEYQLLAGLQPSDVVRVETTVRVAPGDARAFTADLPYRAVELGVGYEVRDFDGNGTRTLLITHDASLGYAFADSFTFTLLPPVGDAPPLEIRARALGAGQAQVLADSGAQPAAFAKGAEAHLPLADTRCGGAASCTGNETCCGSSCTDVSMSSGSCGACGNACGNAGDECTGGACRCNGGTGCAAGQSCCADLGCVSTDTDPFNCGACGKACALGETCENGGCKCGATPCTPGQVCCRGVCTDGGCACAGGTCAPSEPLCCGDACANTADDDANCGACGKACAAPFRCAAGACKCNGTSICGGSDTCCPTGCKGLDNDPANCGNCGKACGSGEICSGGQCACGSGGQCGDGKACCADPISGARSCADTMTDENNCGGCGILCTGAQQCVGGQCQCPGAGMACVAGQSCCPGSGCFDLTSDHDHCGACGTACGATEACQGGACRPAAVLCMPSCTNGTTCVGGTCFCGSVQTRCANATLGELCCAGHDGCIDTVRDVKNCGGCGIDCAAMGKQQCCSSMCLSFNDDANCGSCGNKCTGLTSCKMCNGIYGCQTLGLGCPTGGN